MPLHSKLATGLVPVVTVNVKQIEFKNRSTIICYFIVTFVVTSDQSLYYNQNYSYCNDEGHNDKDDGSVANNNKIGINAPENTSLFNLKFLA